MTKTPFSISLISENNVAPYSPETVKFHLFCKRILVLAIGVCFSLFVNAQVSKTANVTAGNLSSALTETEFQTITDLTLTGTIDARDFLTIRFDMPLLLELNLSEVAIVEYTGTKGTSISGSTFYPANEVPEDAFTHNIWQQAPIIKSIILPKSITTIGASSFFNCKMLTSVTIPPLVTSIGAFAFYGCSGLTSLMLPPSVISIGDFAFYGCSGLTSITIPPSVTSIGGYTFYCCSGLTSVMIPPSVTSIEDSAFLGCSSLTSVTIPPSVISIGNNAFQNCAKLTSITIPPSVTYIGGSAFWECRGLTSVSISPMVTSIGDWTFKSCISLTSITIPPSVTSIGGGAFYDCSGLTSVTIPPSVTSIGYYAFGDCSGLTSVTIPPSVTSIGNSAFNGCRGLTSVTIPSSVISIGEYAFTQCSGLNSITIPPSVVSIGEGAFIGLNGMINVDENNLYYSSIDGVLFNKTQTAINQCPISEQGQYAIPSSVTSIGYQAFRDCAKLTSVTIPPSVTSIEGSAFYGCNGLTVLIAANPIPVNFPAFSLEFEGISKTNCTLYVPVGSKSAYQAANGWKEFKNIVEDPTIPVGIAPWINQQQLTAYPNPTSGRVKLILDQLPQNGTYVTVTDVSGRMILKQLMLNKEELINLQGNSPGVYFIKSNLPNTKAQKVILK